MFEASSTVHWIALLVTVVGVALTCAATYGAVMTRLKVAERTIESLTKLVERLQSEQSRGAQSQGRRIGIVEERVAHLEGRSNLPRHRSQLEQE